MNKSSSRSSESSTQLQLPQSQVRAQLQMSHSQSQVRFQYPFRWEQSETPESRYYTAENTPAQQEAAENVASAVWFKREEMVKRANFGLRLSEVVFCLISFSVMATDNTPGWSGDSFYRYKEYRYCLSVNVIGCAYSTLQACDAAYQLISGRKKHAVGQHLRYHLNFLMDQTVAYLLMSAASSAATRVYDWESNWGKDEFTHKASVSVAMAFLAFVAFAFSSLISLYTSSTRTTI